ncbi:MAG TPA: calcium-binding protein [Solirubrobacteraceae bacterium]|nr:calcium-binding protein [Solirubrobacteraceae bacterium]
MPVPRRLLSLGVLLLTLASVAALTAAARADHIVGIPCVTCASHDEWPRIDIENVKRADKEGTTQLDGSEESDELMGHHTSDVLRGFGASDVLWGDYDPNGQPKSQVDRIYGGSGEDFIYGSHGRNVIYGGKGNDAISVHYGRGMVNCGPGRDIYHVARSRKRRYRFRNCEKVEYRTEKQRGGGLKPLP